MDTDHPAQGERWSPDGSDVDASDLTPQAVKADIEHQSQAKHDGEPTGRTPAPQPKKQRNEDYDLRITMRNEESGRILSFCRCPSRLAALDAGCS
eukprot:1184192-Pyramimonas_sp.AAC.1